VISILLDFAAITTAVVDRSFGDEDNHFGDV
jgi:hypothetical protein